jgi:transcriptional regulator with XRE-family HTH domain
MLEPTCHLDLYRDEAMRHTFLRWPLSQRLQWLRAQHTMSLEHLAYSTALRLTLLESLEAGLDTVVATTHRLRLARAFNVDAAWLLPQAPARAPSGEAWVAPHADPWVDTATQVLHAHGKRLALLPILANPEGFWPCPQCGHGLVAHTHTRYTTDDEPLTALRLTCSQCTFHIVHDWPEALLLEQRLSPEA